MKKTLTANIGGTVFNIEEDAFERLQRYLASIRAQFAGSPGTAEIMADIESRIAELFQQRLESRQVVDIADVEHVIGVMGQPEDILGEEAGAAGAGPGAGAGTGEGRRYRRLYRDPDDRWIGGVLGGIAAYFSIDPLVLRLIYLVALFMGWGILLYIILWIVMPVASSAAEKLEMRGEPVTVDNIKRMFDLGRRYGPRAREGARGFFGFLGEMIRLFLRFLGRLFGVLLLLFGACLVVMLMVLLLGRYDVLLRDPADTGLGLAALSDHLFLSHGQGNWAWIAGLVFVLVPVTGLLYAGLSLLFDVKGPRWLGWTLAPLWIASIAVLTVVGIQVGNDFRARGEEGEEIALAAPAGGTLHLRTMGAKADAGWSTRYMRDHVRHDGPDFELSGDSIDPPQPRQPVPPAGGARGARIRAGGSARARGGHHRALGPARQHPAAGSHHPLRGQDPRAGRGLHRAGAAPWRGVHRHGCRSDAGRRGERDQYMGPGHGRPHLDHDRARVGGPQRTEGRGEEDRRRGAARAADGGPAGGHGVARAAQAAEQGAREDRCSRGGRRERVRVAGAGGEGVIPAIPPPRRRPDGR